MHVITNADAPPREASIVMGRRAVKTENSDMFTLQFAFRRSVMNARLAYLIPARELLSR